MAEEFTWGQTIMKRIAILVEGESEEKFVGELNSYDFVTTWLCSS